MSLLARTLRSELVKKFIIAVIIVAVIHHLDHILRYDHSGWPFRSDPQVDGAHLVTPFTYSLLVYPFLISLLFVKNRMYRLTVSIVLGLIVVGAHAFLELPAHQYATWAENSSPYGALAGHHNVPNVASPLIGRLAVGWSLLLDACAVALPILIYKERPSKAASELT